MHDRLNVPKQESDDPLSLVMNCLPKSKPRLTRTKQNSDGHRLVEYWQNLMRNNTLIATPRNTWTLKPGYALLHWLDPLTAEAD